jgi:hypothetical protein
MSYQIERATPCRVPPFAPSTYDTPRKPHTGPVQPRFNFAPSESPAGHLQDLLPSGTALR